MASRKKGMHFVGLLSNVDSSILKVDLEHGFRLEAIPTDEGFSLFSTLERISPSRFPIFGILGQYFSNIRCINQEEGEFYVIENSLLYTPDSDLFSRTAELKKASEFRNNFVLGYLNPVIRLMRLFKEGDIRMPLIYFYVLDDKKVMPSSKFFSNRQISWEMYRLEDTHLGELHEFIHETKIPFSEPSLQLAFENFERSYEIDNESLSFVTLIISLETLLNKSAQELRYRISRNAAVLLGEDQEDSKKIFTEIKGLYDIRSEIVHSGKSKKFTKRDLLRLRHYVRESIKKIYSIGQSKEEILNLLNSRGFGEKPSIE